MASFLFIYLFKGTIFKYSLILRYCDIRASTYEGEFGGDNIQPGENWTPPFYGRNVKEFADVFLKLPQTGKCQMLAGPTFGKALCSTSIYLSTGCGIQQTAGLWLSEKAQCQEVWAAWYTIKTAMGFWNLHFSSEVTQDSSPISPSPNEILDFGMNSGSGRAFKIMTQIEFPIKKWLRVRFPLTWSNVMCLLTEMWSKIHLP